MLLVPSSGGKVWRLFSLKRSVKFGGASPTPNSHHMGGRKRHAKKKIFFLPLKFSPAKAEMGSGGKKKKKILS